uniref:Reverse transcriptase domain-containing protein n=1 Tax=Candidatus Methanogaster sp. ANME-2c ERB4 TaxID=2759911 RepID=A0A7G9YDV1_9EURY|nr:hypothetical protein NDLBFEBI_00007 [Methanosarcinales archaeon ANME-2c ERB4]
MPICFHLSEQEKLCSNWVLEGDIKGCFDNISHEWLLDNVPMDKSILTQFLKAGFVFNRYLNPTKAGTPQGGIISPILANMTLDEMEMAIASRYHVGKNGVIDKRRFNPEKVHFVRYADDFVVTATSKETAEDIAEVVKEFLKERGLELSDEKTHVTHIDDGFDFLGWNFRKYKEKLLITRFSAKRKSQPKRCHAGMTRSTLFKCPFSNRVVIIGNSTCVL